MKDETKLFWYAVSTFLLSLILLTIGVLFYFYQSISIVQPHREALKDFAINLALWESIVGISGVFFIHRLFNVHLKHKRETQEIFKGLFQAVSHRFGNFLATQKVIITLLTNNPHPEAIKRLEQNVSLMERDFLQLVAVLKNFESTPFVRKRVKLSEIVYQVVEELESTLYSKEYRIKITGDCSLNVEPLLLKTVINLLLDNSFRYGKKEIYIRCGRTKGQVYCFISNDIKPSSPKGTGLGLKLSRYFANLTGGSISTREKKERFSTLIVWREEDRIISRFFHK